MAPQTRSFQTFIKFTCCFACAECQRTRSYTGIYPAPITHSDTHIGDPNTYAPGSFFGTAESDGRFTILVAAVQAAGLVELENLETLQNFLDNHVVPGKVMAAYVDCLDGEMVGTVLEGREFMIALKERDVYLNDDVQVIIIDIEISNGVIDVIDSVLLVE